MIFVTVGTHTAPFDRLIRWMDEIAGRLAEPVVQQIGSATYLPARGEHFCFCTADEIKSWILRSRAVVTHGGASVREIIGAGRPAVVVPRLRRYGEVVDDHQLELARALAGRGALTLALDSQSLETALRAPSLPAGSLPSPEPLIQALRETIERFQ